MKALPSIAFNEFQGSAGDVTARVSKGRQVLSARSMHSSSKTLAQAVSRNRLAKISRSYKKLSDEKMKAWAVLAEKVKGISTFGQASVTLSLTWSRAEKPPYSALISEFEHLLGIIMEELCFYWHFSILLLELCFFSWVRAEIRTKYALPTRLS